MLHTMNRRIFLSRAALGFGTLAMSGSAGSAAAESTASHRETKLLATTDYCDNALANGQLFDRAQLDELHAYLASIGVTRHQWILDTMWDLYDGDASGFDLLLEAAQSAHAYGIEFYAEIKPFEGGGIGHPLPLTLPFPDAAVALRDIRGIYPMARAFVARNPQFCLQRRPGTYAFHGPIKALRLVKGDDQPTRINAKRLSLWSSATNNHFERYEGPCTFRESVEWRQAYPTSRLCRVLHFEGLALPETHRYLLIRCELKDPQGDFTNERGKLVELIGPDGSEIPCLLSTGPEEYDAAYFKNPLRKRIVAYFQLPEVEQELLDPERGQVHYQDFFNFVEHRKITEAYTLEQEGYVAIACGKPEFMLGNLHPIYPEVRAHWLDLIRYCLDRGVDGINIRHSNHVQSPEDWEYGFNPPAIEAAGGQISAPAIQRVNGDAYTQFLREARELIKSRGKSITLHLYAQMLAPDDRPTRLNYLPPNFAWQWETWIKEIADDLELRGVWTLRPWNLRQVLETFSAAARAAGKPLYFEGNQKELIFDGPHEFTRREMGMIRDDPGVDGFVLYETATFTRMNETGKIEGSPSLAEVIKAAFFPQRT